MPLTQQEKQDRREYVRRQLVKNKVDINNAQNIFDWMEEHNDELNDASVMQTFLVSERDAELRSKLDEAKTLLEDNDYQVNKR